MVDFLCGLDAAVAVIGGKWKPLILWALSEHPRRTGELRRELTGVSEKVLTQQLRELERDGIVHREVHQEVPPKVVYSLTAKGRELDRALRPLGDWGEEHREAIAAVRGASAGAAEPVSG
ncbi:DNA-binding HxlR family transcriptional regulator [Diaminobutyricimonas aerilata]|uniref:DNA-binding HxlR family transcriptional regulator n=1 Tax=Diaminobutyricimonas aerilata TaxID=1162967 RepID=A0A2M9CHI6_9MICO|nr:helix-turn-helix domain-containing protein [Diaminobutyricimonas aerilata]PJJ71332.1 DNA-binding HxlR family transcriptional regulator [Diaminobutyricimonas aerilata]